MKTIINGIEAYYEDSGNSSALPIVLVHAFPLSHEMWQPQIDPLASKYRVISYDIRGHGKSGIGDGQYMLEFFVDDLIGLLDFLQLDKAVLCGLSMGGYIVLRAAERNPERIYAMILADTQSKSDSNEAKIKRTAAIKLLKTKGVQAYADSFAKGAFAPENYSGKTDAVDKIKQIIQSNTPLGIGGAILALAGRTDTTSFLSKVKIPTLIIVGESDALTPVSLSEEMRAQIPDSEMHVIGHAGHLSNLENPDEFNKHLLNFLDKIA
jgi:3-oxoadipate enol-lactonase